MNFEFRARGREINLDALQNVSRAPHNDAEVPLLSNNPCLQTKNRLSEMTWTHPLLIVCVLFSARIIFC